MLPPTTADQLNELGHDAVGVAAAGLAGTDDAVVYAAAVDQERAMVTEDFADFSALLTQRQASDERCLPIVFVRKREHPRGGALAPHLARHLHRWAINNPDPYPGLHWP